jgi:hypothetical protein
MLRREGAGRCMRAAWDPAGNGAQVSTPCCRDCLYRRLLVLGYPVLGLSKLAKLCWEGDIAGQTSDPRWADRSLQSGAGMRSGGEDEANLRCNGCWNVCDPKGECGGARRGQRRGQDPTPSWLAVNCRSHCCHPVRSPLLLELLPDHYRER